jgi:ABC-type Fe3+-citrate transport system substrate-binding protein
MNSKIKTYILLFAASLFIAACGNSGHEEEGHEHEMVKHPNTMNTEKGMKKKSTFPNNSFNR